MTKKKALETAQQRAKTEGGAFVVWRRNLLPNAMCRAHMCYDYAVHPKGYQPRTPNVDAIATFGTTDDQAGFDL